MDPQKVAAVQEWPVSASVAEICSFFGLCTYYRCFVSRFTEIASPLHHLTRKEARFEWSDGCQEAFSRLKKVLMEAPVLPFPDPSSPYLLDIDSSAGSLGSVLSQVKDSKKHVVAFYSSKLTKPERNYCITRRELLAVVKSVEHFHPYLYGAKFTVRTDHAALGWFKSLKAPEGQLARWLGRLEQFQYEVQHRPGRAHNNAYSLSRRPCEPDCAHCSRKEEQVECQLLRVADEAQETEEQWRWAQREDAELAPVIQWREGSAARPSWQQMVAEGPATKHLWQQWALLRLQDGVLQRR